MITVLISPLEFCHMQKFLHLACLWQPNWLQTYGFFRRAPAGTFTTQRENPFRRAARRLTRTGRQPDPIDNRWGQTVQNQRENPFQRADCQNRQTAGTLRQQVRSNSTESAGESLPESGPAAGQDRQTARTHRQQVRSNSTESAWESLPKSGPADSRNSTTTGEVKQYTMYYMYSITVLQWLICLGLAPQVEDLTRPVVQRREAPGMEIR